MNKCSRSGQIRPVLITYLYSIIWLVLIITPSHMQVPLIVSIGWEGGTEREVKGGGGALPGGRLRGSWMLADYGGVRC